MKNMAFAEKLSTKDLYWFIVDFTSRYNVTPGVGFLSGYYKMTPQTIHRKLNDLEKEGKIKQIKKVKNIVKYELIK